MSVTIVGRAAAASPLQTVSVIIAVSLQAGSLGFLGAATVIGIKDLARRARPAVWPILGALSLPIAFVVRMPMVALVWAVTG